ncbi:DENN domain-containing protein 4B-like [Leucoraja erinacea]|uniref:DENN domain-containing protein 4B-like n=1 Tax=Leucoraja erinaceus TaxID=7782 RepID=UPI00245554A5|nr:DENN domain-containing protein 4B-like [Leucoraja erinacea]
MLDEEVLTGDGAARWSSTLAWVRGRGEVRGPHRSTLPYLSPLVLRKEVESLLENEGEAVLGQTELLLLHPVLYWNLLWYFQRLQLPHQLLPLLLAARHGGTLTQEPVALACGSNTPLRVRVLWDALSIEPDSRPPLYVLWRMYSESPSPHRLGCRMGRLPARCWRSVPPLTLGFLEEVVAHVGLNEVHKAIVLVLDSPATRPRRSFDKKYHSACGRLASSLSAEQLRQERVPPPSAKAIDCRKTFGALLEC